MLLLLAPTDPSRRAGYNRSTRPGKSRRNLNFQRSLWFLLFIVMAGLGASAARADGWISQKIGAAPVDGSAIYDAQSGSYAINAAGSDIGGNADAFEFVFQALVGDGQIVARVASIQASDPAAKAGVMIRETLAPNALNASVLTTPGNGTTFQSRVATGKATT